MKYPKSFLDEGCDNELKENCVKIDELQYAHSLLVAWYRL